jgi:hypothetical protein
VPHNAQHNLEKTLSYASDLNDGTNPIDKALSSLRYSSIPHFKFESDTSQPNEHSRNCVVRSGDDWFGDLEESDVWTGPMAHASKTIAGTGRIYSSQIVEIDSDTDSSSSAPSTDTESEAEHWLRMKEDHAVGGCHWEKGVNDSEKLPRSHGNQVHYSTTKNPIVPQNIRLKGMARLRRISPRAIKTTLQDTEHRVNVIQEDLAGILKEPKVTANNIKVPLRQSRY